MHFRCLLAAGSRAIYSAIWPVQRCLKIAASKLFSYPSFFFLWFNFFFGFIPFYFMLELHQNSPCSSVQTFASNNFHCLPSTLLRSARFIVMIHLDLIKRNDLRVKRLFDQSTRFGSIWNKLTILFMNVKQRLVWNRISRRRMNQLICLS